MPTRAAIANFLRAVPTPGTVRIRREWSLVWHFYKKHPRLLVIPIQLGDIDLITSHWHIIAEEQHAST